MKLNRMSLIILGGCAFFLSLFAFTPATYSQSKMAVNCYYYNGAIYYEILGGLASHTYIVDGSAVGCVSLGQDPPDLVTDAQGNSPKQSVAITCNYKPGDATVQITIKESQTVTLKEFQFKFLCEDVDGTCKIRLVSPFIPSLSHWGLLILVIFLVAAGLWVAFRHKKRPITAS